MSDSNPIDLAQYIVKQLNKHKIGILEVQEVFSFDAQNNELRNQFFADKEHKSIRPYLKPHFTNGIYVANAGFDFESGNKLIQEKEADAISFGTGYICNPQYLQIYLFIRLKKQAIKIEIFRYQF